MKRIRILTDIEADGVTYPAGTPLDISDDLAKEIVTRRRGRPRGRRQAREDDKQSTASGQSAYLTK